MQQSFILQLIKRLNSQSPTFFKNLQKISMIAIAASISVNYLFDQNIIHLTNQVLQENITNVANAIWKISTGSLFSSLTSTTDPELMDNKTKSVVVNQVLQEEVIPNIEETDKLNSK